MQLKNSCRHIALTFAGMVMITLSSYAQVNKQALMPELASIPMDPSVRTGKLPNGFTYYIKHNEEPKKRVIMYLANKVGSILENEDQRGLAHFMEHMSFNGTTHFPKNELVDYLQKSGVRFGADLNAYTGFDETVYQLPLPADNPDILNNGLQIMRDWAQEATLDPVEIDKERGVVLEEKRLGKGAKERFQRQYLPVILNHSRYAERVPIGLDTVLNNFKPETLRGFYRDWYRPNLQALIVVGDIDVDKMEQAIKNKFASLKNPDKEKERRRFSVPLTGENHFIELTDKEMTGTTAEVIIKRKGEKMITAADYRRGIIENLFNHMMAQRYAELLRLGDSPFLGASSNLSDFIGGLSSFTVSVSAKPGQLETGFKTAWREAERVGRYGFTPTELDRAKKSYLNTFETLLEEKNKTSSSVFVDEYLANFLHHTAAPGIDYEYNQVKNDITEITLAELNAISKEAIRITDRDIVILAPEKDKASLPDEPTFLNWMTSVEKENVEPYQDAVSDKPLISVQPKAGKIINQQYDAKTGLYTLIMANGVKVLLKKTAYKNDEILFNGFASGGTSLYGDNDYQSATAANMIPSFGAGNYNTMELQKYLAGKSLHIRAAIVDRTQNISGASVNRDLETALQLTYAYFTAPRKDQEVYKGIIDRSTAALVNRANDPASVFSDTVNAVLGNYSIRRTGPSLGKLGQINLDRAYEIYKERFADASNFTFVFVGSINVETIKPLLEKYLGGLPTTHKNESARDLHINTPEGLISRTVFKGSEPRATVELVFTGDFDYSFENVIKMNAIKECLEIRLLERLREEESGVYSPSVSVSETKFPRSRFGLTVSFGCAPQNVDKLISSTLDEIAIIKKNGPPQININKFKAEEQRTMESQLMTNGFWLSYISTQLLNQERLNEVDNFQQQLSGITPAEIKAAAEHYLTGKNYIRLVLMPEK